MRVGKCFSRVLDPARPPLFGDGEGCAPLPDEGWPGDLPADTRAGSATLLDPLGCAASFSAGAGHAS